jgi:hypothetical protein
MSVKKFKVQSKNKIKVKSKKLTEFFDDWAEIKFLVSRSPPGMLPPRQSQLNFNVTICNCDIYSHLLILPIDLIRYNLPGSGKGF